MNKKLLLVVVGAIVLCFAGLNNKFPLLTTETAGYIQSGFTRSVPFDRPLLYGLFVAHVSWWKSLWFVIFGQALILSLTLFYCFKYFLKKEQRVVAYLICVFFLAFCSSASVTASSLDVGVFGGITILSAMLLLFCGNLEGKDRWIIAAMYVISAGMELSHIFMSLLLVLIIGGFYLLRGKAKPAGSFGVTGFSWLVTLGAVASACIVVAFIHFCSGSGFGLLRDWRVAFIPRMAKMGLVEKNCKSGCAGWSSRVCCECDELVANVSVGGRLANPMLAPGQAESYYEISKYVTSNDNFWGKLLKESVAGFHNELLNVQIDERVSQGRVSMAPQAVFQWYNDDFRESSISRQMARWLNYDWLNYTQLVVVLFCVLFSLSTITGKIRTDYVEIHLFILTAYVVYAFVTVVLYGESNSQYQVAWLVVVPLVLTLTSTRLKLAAVTTEDKEESPLNDLNKEKAHSPII